MNPGGGTSPTVKPEDLRDWQAGLKLMLGSASRFEPYNENGGVDSSFPIRGSESSEGKLQWDVIDPDGS